MVLTRSMAVRRTPLALPHDMVVEIAAHIAAPDGGHHQPTRHLPGHEGVVGSRVALEREESMRWFDHDRYLVLVDNLAASGNPEACFVLGLTLVFAQRSTAPAGGIEWLRRAAAAGHKVAAYVLGVLHYGYGDDKEAERYIRQGEGEQQAGGGRTNRECVMYREQAVQAVREVTWKVDDGVMSLGLVPVSPAGGGRRPSRLQGKGLRCARRMGWWLRCVL